MLGLAKYLGETKSVADIEGNILVLLKNNMKNNSGLLSLLPFPLCPQSQETFTGYYCCLVPHLSQISPKGTTKHSRKHTNKHNMA